MPSEKVKCFQFYRLQERKPTEIKMENEEDTSYKEMIEKLVEISDEVSKRL